MYTSSKYYGAITHTTRVLQTRLMVYYLSFLRLCTSLYTALKKCGASGSLSVFFIISGASAVFYFFYCHPEEAHRADVRISELQFGKCHHNRHNVRPTKKAGIFPAFCFNSSLIFAAKESLSSAAPRASFPSQLWRNLPNLR